MKVETCLLKYSLFRFCARLVFLFNLMLLLVSLIFSFKNNNSKPRMVLKTLRAKIFTVRIGKILAPRVGSRTHRPGALRLDDLGKKKNHLCLTTLEYKPTVHRFLHTVGTFFFYNFIMLSFSISSSRPRARGLKLRTL